jgi:glycosyltransferase involved in cell wall biosynthesis
MKCLFLCTALDIGGTETYLLRFARHIRSVGELQLTIVCKSGRKGVLAQEFEDLGVIVLPMRQGFFAPISWMRLWRHMRQAHYQAICDFTGNFAGIPLLLAKSIGTKRRISFYRHTREAFGQDFFRVAYCKFVNRLVAFNTTNILSNSEAALGVFFPTEELCTRKKFRVISNGIPRQNVKLSSERRQLLRQELGIPESCYIVGHVGRFAPSKNQGQILESAAWFQGKKPDTVFLLVGRDVEQNLSGELRRLQLRNVFFAGERRDVPELLQIMNAFYFPSIDEGQPNALLEAIVSGLQFVSSNIAEIRSCFPSWWGDKWLCEVGDIETSCRVLVEHLDRQPVIDRQFSRLVSWCEGHYSEEKRFQEFLSVLSS